jgi:chemotaxis protein CheC
VTAAQPTAPQQDALREAANIGGGHAASMLSRLVGGLGVMVEVPRIAPADGAQLVALLGGAGTHVLGAEFTIEGGLDGKLFWVLPKEDARRLGARLLRRPTSAGHLSADEALALSEAANIVASACLSVLSGLTRLKLYPSPPDLADGDVATLLAGEGRQGWALETRFQSTDAPSFGGQLLLLLSPEGVKTLLDRLGL